MRNMVHYKVLKRLFMRKRVMLTNYDLKARARNQVKGQPSMFQFKLSIFLIIWQILSSVWDETSAGGIVRTNDDDVW